jgi:hypothetical protein
MKRTALALTAEARLMLKRALVVLMTGVSPVAAHVLPLWVDVVQ